MPNAILDPTGTASTKAARPAAARAPRRASLRGARVGLLINTQQNAAPVLHERMCQLPAFYSVEAAQTPATS